MLMNIESQNIESHLLQGIMCGIFSCRCTLASDSKLPMLGKPNSHLSHLLTFPMIMGLAAVSIFCCFMITNTIMSCWVCFLFVTKLFLGFHLYFTDFLIQLSDKLTWGHFVTFTRADSWLSKRRFSLCTTDYPTFFDCLFFTEIPTIAF